MTDQRPLPIAGKRVTKAEGVEVRAPFDGALLGYVPRCDGSDVDRALAGALEAHQAGPMPTWQRAEVLDRAAVLLAERRDDFARTIALEAAKPIRSARIEAERAVSTFSFAAAEARTLAGDVVPLDASAAGEGHIGFTMRLPIGVVAAVSPFNFPLNLVAHKVAPAIAAGCPIVLKPASQTPLSALALADLLIDECGLPAEQLSVVTGSGGSVGSALVEDRRVAFVSFTGSPEVGWSIKGRASRAKVALELGNNAPVIIEPDGDWATAADKIKVAGFSHAGQSCISTQRVYVHDDVADDFVARLVEGVRGLQLGDPLQESTDVSQLISTSERDRIVSWIRQATDGGARVATGGDVRDGLLAPTVLLDVLPDMKVCRAEVFGPLVGVARYRTLDEALAMANDTDYGLHAAIYTASLASALKAVRTLDFGGVLVNEVPTWRADQMPYGGVRDSGNTREGPHYSVREMTEHRMVVLGS